MVDWRGRRRSKNVIDARGRGGPRMPRMGGGRGVKLGGGLGTVGIIIVVIMFFMGGDPMQLLGILLGGGGSGGPVVQQAPSAPRPAGPVGNDDAAQFMSVILADTEETWGRLFREAGQTYPEPKLVLFSNSVQSACGFGSAASGPFYCPGDRQLYLDLSFFQQLEQLGAPGDFAQAYVIGHEVGHHVQTVTNIIPRVQQAKSRMRQAEANALQVLVELQADCFAGVWAHHAENRRDLLERGDVEEGLQAAASIGDDALQRRSGRGVRPESFTHGTSQQRMRWFKRGIDSGDIGQCDTFGEAGVNLR